MDPAALAAYAQAAGLALTGAATQAAGGKGQAEGGMGAAGPGSATQAGTGSDRQVLERRVRELEAERDWLRGLVDGLTRALPDPGQQNEPEPRRAWPKIAED